MFYMWLEIMAHFHEGNVSVEQFETLDKKRVDSARLKSAVGILPQMKKNALPSIWHRNPKFTYDHRSNNFRMEQK